MVDKAKATKKPKIVNRKPDDDVPLYKKNQLKDIIDMAKNHKVIALACWTGIPSAQMQMMRQGMGKDIQVKIVRNRLLYLGLREVLGKNKVLEELLLNVDGQTALVATDLNPFKLFRRLEGTKTKSPSKGGETAPEDVIVTEGETEFKPGPIVGELQKAGIPAGIEGGKVVIKSTKTLVKAGAKIPKATAVMITRLGILPLTVGLDLKAALEMDTVYKKDVLAVDDVLIMSQITGSAASAFNLAMFVEYPTELTIKPLISKAYREAMGVTMKAAIVNKESVGPLFAKAQAQAAYIKGLAEGKLDAGKPHDPISGEVVAKKPDKKPDKDVESDQAAGLGNLFG
jgi:large subunit ribosomal protein L10